MNAAEVRDFEAGDQDEVRALVLDGLREHWGELDDTLNPDLRDITRSYGHGRTVVALVDGTVVGTGTVVPVDGDSAIVTAEIVRMAVAKLWRRSGIGRRIVDELVATAASWGFPKVTLETTSTWPDAMAFYQSCGFAITRHAQGRFGPKTWFERPL
ncbi:MAG TPA: GNAT family N-acetyltransferase [Acidimicrobiales bacterium]|jgi:GNAT superfamily N-acetyltransferase